MTFVETAAVLVSILRALTWPAAHKDAGALVFRSQEELQKVWVADGGKADELPKVDWDQEMVLAVFMGEKPTGGFSVRIEKVVRLAGGEPETLAAICRCRSPGADEEVTQALTCPAHVVVVPRFKGKVTFPDADAETAQKIEELLKKNKPRTPAVPSPHPPTGAGAAGGAGAGG